MAMQHLVHAYLGSIAIVHGVAEHGECLARVQPRMIERWLIVNVESGQRSRVALLRR